MGKYEERGLLQDISNIKQQKEKKKPAPCVLEHTPWPIEVKVSFYNTRPCATLRAAGLDWIVGTSHFTLRLNWTQWKKHVTILNHRQGASNDLLWLKHHKNCESCPTQVSWIVKFNFWTVVDLKTAILIKVTGLTLSVSSIANLSIAILFYR